LYLDTTEMTIDQVVVHLMELAEGVLK
ncbi:MAG TPA: cytidylate kinase, partial [Exiguobacterium sp.]|nr:cytidylate kinase [Exiguobacterium sp.]